MGPNEDDGLHDNDGDAQGKRRRVQRACDVCRKKKIRCDGLQPEKGACSNCASYGHHCTFVDATKRRAPPRSYVIALEARMERAERLIQQLLPNVEVDKAIGPMPELPSETKRDGDEGDETVFAHSSSDTRDGVQQHSQEPSDMSRSSVVWDACADGLKSDEEANDEEEDAAFIRIQMENVNLISESEMMLASFKGQHGTQVYDLRDFEHAPLDQKLNDKDSQSPLLYYGHASGIHLFPALHRLARGDDDHGASIPARSPCTSSASAPALEIAGLPNEPELDWSEINFSWPTQSMQAKLLDLYFQRANPQYPVLNEVVFRKRLQKPDWKSNDRGGCLLALGVFALATRYVTDEEERLYAPVLSMADHWATLHYSLILRRILPIDPSLDYIQSLLLLLLYHHSSAQPRTTFTWLFLGACIRLLVDMGGHRKFTATRSNFDLLTEETYRRCFWVTYVLDKVDSADMGRPVALQDEDIDLDDMLLVDDEYLVSASEKRTPAVQPDDKPSKYHGFHQMVKLSRIIGRTLRTIYAISKSKAARGFVGKKWDAYIVGEIDKSLNKWLEQVPPHLSYSPMETNQDWLIQSSRLFLMYYHIQALVHRPFVQRYKFGSPQTFHSLAIVSNASRSAIHVTHNLVQRGLTSLIGLEGHLRIFIFGCYLLLISYSAKKKNFSVSSAMVEDTRKATEALHSMQNTWRMSARMAEHLDKLLARLYPSSASPSVASGSHEINAHKRSFDVQGGEALPPVVPSQAMGDAAFAGTQREIRGLRQSLGGAGATTDAKLDASRLPVSTSELEGRFKDSPPSAFDQVAALSGWARGELNTFVGSNAPPSFAQQSNPGTAPGADQMNFNQPFSTDSDFYASAMRMAAAAGASNMDVYGGGGIGSTLGPSATDNVNPPTSFTMDSIRGGAMAGNADALRHDTFLSGALPTPSLDVPTSVPPSFLPPSAATTTTTNVNNVASPPRNTAFQSPGIWPSSFNAAGHSSASSSDPLDALSSLNGFWSDSDWMRALQNTTA